MASTCTLRLSCCVQMRSSVAILSLARAQWQYSVLAPVYPIASGDANVSFEATGARLGDLAEIFEEIGGFQ
jgi:hypothetical protein